jgi:hypothetical protein
MGPGLALAHFCSPVTTSPTSPEAPEFWGKNGRIRQNPVKIHRKIGKISKKRTE